ncbi:multidrug efflux pump [Stella humosa]|uniref:Multidrug efflux pump n=1 Tax=Stella humosa TaxID=94 RepID=A0A3N1KYU7_9PROT|nr:efflux RND transporter permease subunit [Stella humosa]ROP83498.1 multidrug efflux pump [Stella humosa]BBK33229.1 acriflavine resistance protein B [Stella humosa]
MNISAPFIGRPIATSLLGIAVLLAGLLGYWQLPVSALPQVDFPSVQVTTRLPGASPETMAALVTAPLERQLGQIPSLQALTSTSGAGISQITLQFDLGRDIDGASQDVQSAINAAGSTLPRTLPYPPTYSKVNPADAPIVTVALTSETQPLRALSDLADTLMAQRLAEVSGVGSVSVQGSVRPAVRVQADLARLSSYGVSLADLRTAIVGANQSGPKGQLDGAQQAYTIAANDQIETAAAYREVVVAYRNGAPVRVGDVATLIDGFENEKVAAWYQSKPAVVIDIRRQPGANVVATVEHLRQELTRLRGMLPAGVELTIVADRTETIRASIHEVQFTLVLCVGLVVLVVLLFLRTLRATLIAAIVLPLSLVATFGAMWLCGFSLDNLSLMALTIGTGFVVDDAIVIIENIVRYMEKGESPMEAAYKGAKEIGFTIISLTASLVAVFIPLLFMTGLVGRMFREFALTLTLAVVLSAVVSLTMTPMLCSRLLKSGHGGGENRLGAAADRAIDWLIEGYRRSLVVVLRHRALTMLVTAGTLAATVALYVVIPKGFLPAQDTGSITAVTEAGQDVSFAELRRVQQLVADAVRQDPDVANVVSVIGVGTINLTPNSGQLSITLKPHDSGRVQAAAVIERLKGLVAPIPGVEVYFRSIQDIQIATRAAHSQYQYTLVGTDAAELSEWSQRLVQDIRQAPAMQDVTSDLRENGLGVMVRVDREQAGRLGVSMQSVEDALNDAFGQRQISTIYGQANQYRVVLEVDPQFRLDPSSLSRLYVPGRDGAQVPLLSVARIERTSAPLSINHEEQFPAVTISFNLAQGASLSDAVQVISAAQRRLSMPTAITGSYSGDAAEFEKSLQGQPWLILAAIVAIYIVLGVLYESFIHPATILSTLPSAGVGALLALILFDLDLSFVALIGIILLMGIVKKNAILMIDFALEAERHQGMTPYDAIVQASVLRFRPIIMTTLAALFGALPLALATGPGAELRIPLGVSICGGLILSQLLTLYTTPVIYLLMERLRGRAGLEPAALPSPAE